MYIVGLNSGIRDLKMRDRSDKRKPTTIEFRTEIELLRSFLRLSRELRLNQYQYKWTDVLNI